MDLRSVIFFFLLQISGGYSIRSVYWKVPAFPCGGKELWHHQRQAKAKIMDWGNSKQKSMRMHCLYIWIVWYSLLSLSPFLCLRQLVRTTSYIYLHLYPVEPYSSNTVFYVLMYCNVPFSPHPPLKNINSIVSSLF